MDIIVLILLVISGLEIFLNIFTIAVSKFISLFAKNHEFSNRTKDVIKLITVAIFLFSVVYYLFKAVKVLAFWFGIPLDKSILDIFR